jgi:uncharacterized protein (DUF488 family)
MTTSDRPTDSILWTVGHSNHTLEKFLDLLQRHAIELLIDVRSQPYSGYTTQFNREPLQAAMGDANVKYLFLGDLLGGRVENRSFYDDDGRLRYDLLSAAPEFQRGVEQLLRQLPSVRTAILCGEEDPTHCHRRLLIGRVLAGRGVAIKHIRGDGRVQTEAEIAAEEKFCKTKGQLSLFETEDSDEWKSTRSVLPKRPSSASA